MGVKGAPKMTALTYWVGGQQSFLVMESFFRERGGEKGVEKGITHLALKHAEPPLEDVHNGVVDPREPVNLLVVVHPGHHERGRVILAVHVYAVLHRRLSIPSPPPRSLLLRLDNPPQELNVPAREKVKPAVDIDDPLPGLRALTRERAAELAAGGSAGRPEVDVHARRLARLVCGV